MGHKAQVESCCHPQTGVPWRASPLKGHSGGRGTGDCFQGSCPKQGVSALEGRMQGSSGHPTGTERNSQPQLQSTQLTCAQRPGVSAVRQ